MSWKVSAQRTTVFVAALLLSLAVQAQEPPGCTPGAWKSKALEREDIGALAEMAVAPGETFSRSLDRYGLSMADIKSSMEISVEGRGGLTHAIRVLTAGSIEEGDSTFFLYSPVPDAVRERLTDMGIEVPLSGLKLSVSPAPGGRMAAKLGMLGAEGEAEFPANPDSRPARGTPNKGSLAECGQCILQSFFSSTCEAVATALLCSNPVTAPIVGCQGALAQRVLEFIIGQVLGEVCGGNFACFTQCNVPSITIVPPSNTSLQPGNVAVTVRSTFSQTGTWLARRRSGSGQLLDSFDVKLTGAEGNYSWTATEGVWTLIGGNIPNPLSFTIPWAGGARNVTVSTNRPPSVTITSPANNTLVTGNVTIAASASDDAGVTRVEFFVDNVLRGTDTAAPYTYSWSTGTNSNGSHSLTAKAYDGLGAVGTSSTVFVTVSNSSTPGGLITNGAFEDSASPWSLIGNSYWTNTSSYPHGGRGYIFMGNTNNASGTLSQSLTIPGNSQPSLTFWLNVTTAETTSSIQYDKLYVEVLSPFGNVLSTLATYSNLNRASAGSYSLRGPFSLSAFRGQTISLRFRVVTDGSAVSTFRIDDVSIQ